MSLFKHLGKVRRAEARVMLARASLTEPTATLLARGERFPLTVVSAAAGTGFVLGRLNIHPLRVPGLGALLNGTVAEIVAQGTRLVAEFAMRDRPDDADGDVDS